jgi:hypothetical protein
VKVVFLMRDPVERIWSHLRMQRRFVEKRGNPRIPDEEILTRFYDAENMLMRTRYQDTVSSLEAVFSEDDIHYEFYEKLFTDTAIRKLTSFLHLKHMEPDFDKVLNGSPHREGSVSDQVLSKIAHYYRETYIACFDKFGEQNVRGLWPNSRYI